MANPTRITAQLMAPLGAVAITSVVLAVWFNLGQQSEPNRTTLLGVEPVAAWTDPFIPDPATLAACKAKRCEEIPEAAWPLVRKIRDSYFLACADSHVRRLPPSSPQTFAEYRGLQVIGKSLDQQLYLSFAYVSMRLGSAERGWQPWLYNGDGGLFHSESIATLSRSNLTEWHEQTSGEMLPIDFSCADLPAS